MEGIYSALLERRLQNRWQGVSGQRRARLRGVQDVFDVGIGAGGLDVPQI
jgi:hypothetical protein